MWSVKFFSGGTQQTVYITGIFLFKGRILKVGLKLSVSPYVYYHLFRNKWLYKILVKNLQNQPIDGEDQSDLRFRHITEITILTVQLIVEFAKRLPGFDKLLREDQIALLKVLSRLRTVKWKRIWIVQFQDNFIHQTNLYYY